MFFITVILALLAVASGGLAIAAAGNREIRVAKIMGVAAGALILLAFASTSLVSIDVGQVGVVTRFGAITGRELGPGINLKAPAPFESVVTFDTRVQKDEIAATAASRDLQDVSSKLAVNYHLERGKVSDIYQSVGTDYTAKVLAPAIQESFKSTTAGFTAEELITKRSEVAQQARQNLESRVEKYGISIDSVNIVDFGFSQAFSQAIEQSQVAAQQVVKAQNEVERVKKEAEAAIEKAKGEAAAQREQAQSITPEYLQLKWIEKWNGALPTTVTGDNALLNLPIGK